jgi:hypothetical protein
VNAHDPPKRTGGAETPPSSRPTSCEEDNSRREFAQPCGHDTVLVEQLPSNHLHFAREICATCRRPVRWLPRPETLQRRASNAYKLARRSMCSCLNAWERTFVRSVSQQRKLSPKQQEIVDRLSATHLEGATP